MVAVMDAEDRLDEEQALAAFYARDRSRDGAFVVGVVSTRIYCRASCPARRPARAGVRLFGDGAAARAAGYRACLRCRPDEAARDAEGVARALDLVRSAQSGPTLAEMAAVAGYAPHHFHRLFRRATGVTPAAWVRAARAGRLADALDKGAGVTEAIYAAGYESASRAYADAPARLGMAPARRRCGGAGERIRHAVVATSLGPLLIAATDKGLCRVAFDEDAAMLAARFPAAELLGPDAAFSALVAELVALVDDPARDVSALPLDLRGTLFQEAVWQALRTIPPGETRSYAQLAAMVGRPAAVRATGSACGDNALALVVPCHRVLRSDGTLGGYAYGLERKAALLKREAGKA